MGRTPGVQLRSVPRASFEGQLLLGALFGSSDSLVSLGACCPVGPCPGSVGGLALHLLLLGWARIPKACPGGPDRQEEHGVGRAGQCQPVWEVEGDTENTRVGGGRVRPERGWSAGPPLLLGRGQRRDRAPGAGAGGRQPLRRQWAPAGL